MKNKIITFFITCFLIFNNTVGSFANPLVIAPITLSYESLMALMGIGLAFGLSLPSNEEEYWDYTRNLKNHLQVVDDEYLELLDKTAKEWKNNNHNKPDNDKEPFQIPLIPGMYDALKSLFNNVGNDVSSSYNYIGDVIGGIAVGTPSNSSSDKLKKMYDISNASINVGVLPKNNVYTTIRVFKAYDGSVSYTTRTKYGEHTSNISNFNAYDNKYNISVRRGTDKSIELTKLSSGGGWSTVNPKHYSEEGTLSTMKLDVPDALVNSKNPIYYNPVEPDVDNDILTVPSFPSIEIPTLPDYEYDVAPPIEVEPPIDVPSDNPGDNPSDNPSDSLFPSLGNVTDYIIGLVVPSDSYWIDTWDGLYNNFTNSFPLVDMSNFDKLVTGEKKFPNIDINIMGVSGRVVNGDVVNSIVDWLRPIIAGFMMLCLMLFNYRKIYKTIRGVEPFQGIAQGTSDFRTGISEYNYMGTGLSKSDYEANERELAKALHDHYEDTGKTYKVRI